MYELREHSKESSMLCSTSELAAPGDVILPATTPLQPALKARDMTLIGNLVFFVFGGFIIALGYILGGILLCLTIIGIPFGFQCFKLAGGVLAPFGREVVETEPPGGALSIILNVIWIILPGLELAIMHLILAVIFALTIIGMPIAAQHIKLIPLALLPFGHRMRDI
jgi:uncharacterized membrane protein YccF (DUF307 family)